jgi:hypothetical protein
MKKLEWERDNSNEYTAISEFGVYSYYIEHDGPIDVFLTRYVGEELKDELIASEMTQYYAEEEAQKDYERRQAEAKP